jgi:reactive intermediate/imine deaminase
MKPLALLVGLSILVGAQPRVVVPADGPPPVGPYSPGVIADGYLYVSGQGAKTADGQIAGSFEAQAQQALDNVRAIVEAAGLTLDHVVYTHAYLEDIGNSAALDRVYARYFPKDPPARALIGVARLPGTPVEINAVAVLNLEGRTPVRIPGWDPGQPYSPGMLTHDRLFISSLPGRATGGNVPPGPAAEVDAALDSFTAVTEAAGLSLAHVVFVNPYLTSSIPSGIMNELYAKRFEFGNTPARATISVSALPEGHIVYTGVAVRDLSKRKAVRPKNMAPSPTASPCVFAGDTLYCSAKSGFIPGPLSGVYAATVEHQLRQTMRNQLDNFEEAGLTFTDVVAANVYLDSIDDFAKMNAVYGQYFPGAVKPARTTVQQIAPGKRDPDANGAYPTLEQVSFVAVRSSQRVALTRPVSSRRAVSESTRTPSDESVPLVAARRRSRLR